MLPYYSTGSVLISTVCIRNDRIDDKLPYTGAYRTKGPAIMPSLMFEA